MICEATEDPFEDLYDPDNKLFQIPEIDFIIKEDKDYGYAIKFENGEYGIYSAKYIFSNNFLNNMISVFFPDFYYEREDFAKQIKNKTYETDQAREEDMNKLNELCKFEMEYNSFDSSKSLEDFDAICDKNPQIKQKIEELRQKIKELKENKEIKENKELKENKEINDKVGNEEINEEVGNKENKELKENKEINDKVGNEEINDKVGNEEINEEVGNKEIKELKENKEINDKDGNVEEIRKKMEESEIEEKNKTGDCKYFPFYAEDLYELADGDKSILKFVYFELKKFYKENEQMFFENYESKNICVLKCKKSIFDLFISLNYEEKIEKVLSFNELFELFTLIDFLNFDENKTDESSLGNKIYKNSILSNSSFDSIIDEVKKILIDDYKCSPFDNKITNQEEKQKSDDRSSIDLKEIDYRIKFTGLLESLYSQFNLARANNPIRTAIALFLENEKTIFPLKIERSFSTLAVNEKNEKETEETEEKKTEEKMEVEEEEENETHPDGYLRLIVKSVDSDYDYHANVSIYEDGNFVDLLEYEFVSVELEFDDDSNNLSFERSMLIVYFLKLFSGCNEVIYCDKFINGYLESIHTFHYIDSFLENRSRFKIELKDMPYGGVEKATRKIEECNQVFITSRCKYDEEKDQFTSQ